jgi:glutamate carboxypeptidase
VLIAGHLDTVHDPHGPFRDMTVSSDGKTATGPGAADMKGGILIGVTALEALAECGVDFNWTFLLNSDEETGSFHSFQAIEQAAHEHDIGIALEPALPDGSLVVERMGSGQFKVEVFGRAVHVGRDFTHGVSAVAKLADIIAALAKFSDPQRGLIVNVGPLQGGQVTNIVPDYAACWGNVRFKRNQAAELLEDQFKALSTKGDALPRVAAHYLANRPAKPLIEPVKQLAETARSVAEDLGQSLPFGSTGGVCDGNNLQAAGLPTIDTMGVRGGNLHRPDEFIELSSLVERCQLLAILLTRIADGRVPMAEPVRPKGSD